MSRLKSRSCAVCGDRVTSDDPDYTLCDGCVCERVSAMYGSCSVCETLYLPRADDPFLGDMCVRCARDSV